jgi:hypothetical protein
VGLKHRVAMAFLWARMTPQQKPARTCSSRTRPRRPAAASTLQRFLWPAWVTTVRAVQATEKNSWRGHGGRSQKWGYVYESACRSGLGGSEAQNDRQGHRRDAGVARCVEPGMRKALGSTPVHKKWSWGISC